MPTKPKRHSDKSLLGSLVLAVAIAEPLMTVPQIYDIWAKRNASGVSIITWSSYAIAAVIWLFYGLKIKDRPLIIASTFWILTEGAVIAGTLRY